MELRFERMSVPVLADGVREVKHTELTQEVKLTDGMPDIGRVVTCAGQVLLRSKAWNRDEITVSAGVKIHCLYIPEDGSEVRSVESWIPFQMNFDVDQNLPEGQIRVLPLLRFADGRCVSARKMMIRVGISALCHGFIPSQINLSRVGELPEDVQILNRTYPVILPREAGEKVFSLDEELTIPDSEPKAEKILDCRLHPEITDRKVMGSRLVFKGIGNLHLLYRCPEGNLLSRNFEIPFSQFAELEGSYSPEGRGDILTAVTSLDAELLSPDRIRMTAGLVGQYRIDDRQLLEIPEDAYSPFREIKPEREAVFIPSVLDNRRESVAVRQAVPGEMERSIDTEFLPDYPKIRRNGGSYDLEVPGMFRMIARGVDGSIQGSNARWEGNLSLAADENTDLEAIPFVTADAGASSSGDQTQMDARLEMQLRTTANTAVPMVTALDLGELREPDPERPSVILRRAGEEELWYLAKNAGSTVDAIREANGLQGEPEPGKMLLIPVA